MFLYNRAVASSPPRLTTVSPNIDYIYPTTLFTNKYTAGSSRIALHSMYVMLSIHQSEEYTVSYTLEVTAIPTPSLL